MLFVILALALRIVIQRLRSGLIQSFPTLIYAFRRGILGIKRIS
jgi:hypothetical protein